MVELQALLQSKPVFGFEQLKSLIRVDSREATFMRHPKLLLLLALLSTGILRAQAPAQSNPTRTPDMAQPLPVPGGGAGLGPGGIPKPEDQHTPTLQESRQKAKE